MDNRRKPSQVKIFVKLFEFVSIIIATVIIIISLLAMLSQPDRNTILKTITNKGVMMMQMLLDVLFSAK